jgi:sn1-specific diacylglycerol lipase
VEFYVENFLKFISFHRQTLSKNEPVYQAIWANTTDFDEVLISPVMLQDHMPDTVLSALEKVSLKS